MSSEVDRANTGPAIGPPAANVPEHTDYVANRAAETSGQDPLYSIAPDGAITIVQCGACADLRAQLETTTARAEKAEALLKETS